MHLHERFARMFWVQRHGTNLATGHCGPGPPKARGVCSQQKEQAMKMRHTVIHATAIAFALAALPVLAQDTTSETTTTTTTVKKHDYVYYGDHDIYFAPETKT